MTPRQLKEWRLSLPTQDGSPCTLSEAARRLNGTPDSTYRDWENGRKRLPRMLPLACYAVKKGWRVPAIWKEEDA